MVNSTRRRRKKREARAARDVARYWWGVPRSRLPLASINESVHAWGTLICDPIFCTYTLPKNVFIIDNWESYMEGKLND